MKNSVTSLDSKQEEELMIGRVQTNSKQFIKVQDDMKSKVDIEKQLKKRKLKTIYTHRRKSSMTVLREDTNETKNTISDSERQYLQPVRINKAVMIGSQEFKQSQNVKAKQALSRILTNGMSEKEMDDEKNNTFDLDMGID